MKVRRSLLAVGISLAAQFSATNASADVIPAWYGDYTVVAIRRASDVAGGPNDPTVRGKVGDTVRIGRALSWIGQSYCPNWRSGMSNKQTDSSRDPMLSDVFLPPLTGSTSKGDRRVNREITVRCAGKMFARFHRVDDRLIIAYSPSGLSVYILEMPLSPRQILRFQKQLKTMKFFDGSPKRRWSKQSLRAVAAYAEYRGAKYRFQRTAIGENLLDGLGVLNR